MDFKEFVTIEFIISFPGMMIMVWLMTQFTKVMFDKLFPTLRTMVVVFLWSIVFNAISVAYNGGFNIPLQPFVLIVGFFNIFVVWWATMKAHEMLIEKNKVIPPDVK